MGQDVADRERCVGRFNLGLYRLEWFNGSPVSNQKHENNDKVQIGYISFVFHLCSPLGYLVTIKRKKRQSGLDA